MPMEEYMSYLFLIFSYVLKSLLQGGEVKNPPQGEVKETREYLNPGLLNSQL
jgi:hypothetical protein